MSDRAIRITILAGLAILAGAGAIVNAYRLGEERMKRWQDSYYAKQRIVEGYVTIPISDWQYLVRESFHPVVTPPTPKPKASKRPEFEWNRFVSALDERTELKKVLRMECPDMVFDGVTGRCDPSAPQKEDFPGHVVWIEGCKPTPNAVCYYCAPSGAACQVPSQEEIDYHAAKANWWPPTQPSKESKPVPLHIEGWYASHPSPPAEQPKP